MKAGFWEILLIIVLVLFLFGFRKFPEIAKSIANGVKIFKKELKPEEKTKQSGKKKSITK